MNATTRTAAPVKHESNVIDRFAQLHLMQIKYHVVRESSFLELAVCAFFSGAGELLSKQAGIKPQQSRAQLVMLIRQICNLSERNADGLIDTVDRLSDKYALIENIINQGTAAADQWLNCEDVDGQALSGIVNKYKNLSMFDLGIEGVNNTHAASQHALYAAVDQSVGQMRRRALWLMLVILGLSGIAAFAIHYFWLGELRISIF